MKNKEIRIYKGLTKPTRYFVGVTSKKKDTEDKFGKLYSGNVRDSYINTRWGQLSIPYSWIGKKIIIIVKEQ